MKEYTLSVLVQPSIFLNTKILSHQLVIALSPFIDFLFFPDPTPGPQNSLESSNSRVNIWYVTEGDLCVPAPAL